MTTTISPERDLLRHYLAALVYRTQKAVRGAPATFGAFQAGQQTRSPQDLVRHMTSVLGYACTFFVGGTYRAELLPTMEDEIARFHAIVAQLADHLGSGSPLEGIQDAQLLQGPLADAMTHAGQIALLRRLAGSPIPPENFVYADITVERLGPDQAAPARPDPEWPERPR
jgi:hypothetical protein